MSDADDFAVSQILESLKRDRSVSIEAEEHQIEELHLDGVVKTDLPKAKRQKVSRKRKKEDSVKTKKKDYCKTEKECSVKRKKEDSVRTKKKNSVKIKKEICSSSSFKKFKSLRLRNPPKPFYNAIKCLSIAQKKKVIDIGFGSLLEFRCDGVPSKLGHFVADKFDPKSMKLKLENGDIQITPELIQRMLGIPCGGTPVSRLTIKDTKKECYVKWRAQFVKELRPSDIVIKIEETEDDGIVFVLNFIILFLNTMVECVPSGKCKVDVLERFDEDVDVKSVDWSGYVYACLKKCKFGWKKDDIGSFFTGPLTVLILIYLDSTSFKQWETPINVRAVNFWSVEMMKKREILEMESGGFGYCDIKKLPEERGVQEESELEVIKFLKHKDSSKTKKEVSLKTKKELCSSSNLKKFKSLRLRNPPKPFYSAIKCLSSAQKKKVIDMGFGSLLEFSCDGVPSKLGYFVADKFDPKSMKLQLKNEDIQITPELIQHILGIPCGGTPVSSLPVKDTKKECYVNWRLQFVKELRPSEIVRKIEESEDDGIVFVLNFIILFLNTMVECIPSGKCNVDVLERFDEDVDIKSVDWSGYIYDCLKKCKLGWKQDDTRSFFTGPLTVLVLIYLDLTSFKNMETPINVRAIKFWSVEMMKKREIVEMESGSFGCCEIKNLSEKRVQEESDLEELIKDIDSKIALFLDVKMQLESLFMRGFQKYPNSQLLIEKKRGFDSIFIRSDSKDDTSAAVGPSSIVDDQGDLANLEQEHVDDMIVENFFGNDQGTFSLFTEQEVEVVNENGKKTLIM